MPTRSSPNFVPDDVASIDAAASSIRAELPAEYLLFVGAMGRHKGIEVLLEAHSQLPGAPPLVLLGSRWPDSPSTFPPNTQVVLDVPHASVMAAMAGSLAVLIPSIYPDACPTVAMEAMASRRPVIASRIGGLPDLVDDEETGLLVPADDAGALAAALHRVVADASLRQRMGDAGIVKVRAFMVSAVVERLESAYARTAGPGKARRVIQAAVAAQSPALDDQQQPSVPSMRLGLLPLLSVTMAAGLLLIAVANMAARQSLIWAEGAFWAGLLGDLRAHGHPAAPQRRPA